MHIKYSEAVKLRKEGQSYREIARTVNVSKSSVSKWCKNLELPLLAKEIIKGKTRYPKEKFIAYNKTKHLLVQAENEQIKKTSSKQVCSLTNYELLLIGAALYWAEGYKRQENVPSPRISFVNSDFNMVKLFLRFLREVIKVPEERFKPAIRIYPDTNKEAAVNFWSVVTKIPKDRFRLECYISRLSQGKRPKNSLPYGTLHLRVNSRRYFQQIRGLIDGLIKHNI